MAWQGLQEAAFNLLKKYKDHDGDTKVYDTEEFDFLIRSPFKFMLTELSAYFDKILPGNKFARGPGKLLSKHTSRNNKLFYHFWGAFFREDLESKSNDLQLFWYLRYDVFKYGIFFGDKIEARIFNKILSNLKSNIEEIKKHIDTIPPSFMRPKLMIDDAHGNLIQEFKLEEIESNWEIIRKEGLNICFFYTPAEAVKKGPDLLDEVKAGYQYLLPIYKILTANTLEQPDLIYPGNNVAHNQVEIKNQGPQYWTFSPGEKSQNWQESLKEKIITVGWDEIGDINAMKTLDDVKEKYQTVYSPENDPKNATLAIYDFCHTIKIGDVIFVKDGVRTILAQGVVDSDYIYSAEREKFRHVRKIKWEKVGKWELPESERFAVKTLTNITAYPNFVKTIRSVIDGKAMSNATIDLTSPRNIIFYGPPGTGKTHMLLEIQRQLLNQKENLSNNATDLVWIEDLVWWEVIAVVLLQNSDRAMSVQEILEHPFIRHKINLSSNKHPRNTLWGQLQSHTIAECKNVQTVQRSPPYFVEKLEDSTWRLSGNWKNDLGHLVEEIKGTRKTQVELYKFVTFHQSYSYEDFIESIRPVLVDNDIGESGDIRYRIEAGPFKLICSLAESDPHNNYVVFIDEINRGNISKIFGELITLIEPDKRIGAKNEIRVELPYSKQKFGVPQNVHVIGTMNSVDRSIALVDMALRRRFEFVPLRPNPDLVPEDIEGIPLRQVFCKINERIAVILGQEYQIGHSYFFHEHLQTLEQVKRVWFKSLLPLLSEYLFDDWEKIQMIVGGFVKISPVDGLEGLAKSSYGRFVSEDEVDFREEVLKI